MAIPAPIRSLVGRSILHRNGCDVRVSFEKRYGHVMKVLAVCIVAFEVVAASAENRDEWQQPDRVVADMTLPAGAVVADVGCGEGFLTFRLAKQVGAGGKVYAVDINPKVLDAVRHRIARERRTNVEVIESAPMSTRLPTSSTQSAVLCDVLHEMLAKNRLPLVQDIVRTLKPGGFLFLIDYRKSHDVKFDPYEKLIPREDLLKLASDVGLVLDAEFHYLKYQVFFRFRKPAQSLR